MALDTPRRFTSAQIGGHHVAENVENRFLLHKEVLSQFQLMLEWGYHFEPQVVTSKISHFRPTITPSS